MSASAPSLEGHERRLLLLGSLAVFCVLVFMTVDAGGQWDFVLPFRARKVATVLLVGYAIAVSTVLFQTVTENRVLTPAIMGFDTLYVLLQTCLLFFLGSHMVAALDVRLLFAVEVTVMVLFSAVLHRWLFEGGGRSIHLLLLTGVVLGVLFRSLSSFLQRVIAPGEFAFLEDRFFASFNNPDPDLLVVSAFMTVGASVLGLRLLHACDVLGLGRDVAISLGVDHRRTVSRLLAVVAVLVSVSTALVGPVTFFGLLVANLAHGLVRSHRHVHVLPAAVFLAVIGLLGGQLVLERVFSFGANLRVIIEFLGGLMFITLLMRGALR
ncbi:enterobactin ABC transporter permease [Corallococcus exercitus]|uniref:Iron chelate uptake ABC transporter family permease subunit n=1 Tax=Corallococcus exercitus TaxID=2316736 RepID=A0A3A8IT90_9BACT|nr:iron chelate uptake ABC transporter family permease subunit [Corallococcus exercitus]NOK34862.1 iron chelate uptake ABC transporter family permease subunit [Corallococcus exercitus]RKG83064.1 enterobactin ABC transporter permease [Corallococcus exercitus]